MLKGINLVPTFDNENDFGNQLYFVESKHDANVLETELITAYKRLKSDYESFDVLTYDYTADAVTKCMQDLNRAMRENICVDQPQKSKHYVVIINDVNRRIYDQLKDLLDSVSSIGMCLGITAVIITKNSVSDVFEANSEIHDYR